MHSTKKQNPAAITTTAKNENLCHIQKPINTSTEGMRRNKFIHADDVRHAHALNKTFSTTRFTRFSFSFAEY